MGLNYGKDPPGSRVEVGRPVLRREVLGEEIREGLFFFPCEGRPAWRAAAWNKRGDTQPSAQSRPVVDIRVRAKVVPAGKCALASASHPPRGRN